MILILCESGHSLRAIPRTWKKVHVVGLENNGWIVAVTVR